MFKNWHLSGIKTVNVKKKTALASGSLFSRKRSSEHHFDGLMALMSNDSKKIFLQKRPPENDGLPPTVLVMMFLLCLKKQICRLSFSYHKNLSHVMLILERWGHFLYVFGENIDIINHEWIRFAPGSWRIQRVSIITPQNQSWSSVCHKHWINTASPGDREIHNKDIHIDRK